MKNSIATKDIQDGRSAKGTSESSHASNALLPDGSRKTVYCTLQVVRTAARNQRFSARWLKHDHALGQDRQAMRLLRFLDLLDDHANLRSDALDSRGNLHLFGQLLNDRVRRGCEKAGIPAGLSERLGSEGHEWSELRNEFDATAPISALTPNVRNNVLGSLKALDEVLRHIADEDWLDERARSLGSKFNLESRPAEMVSEHSPYNIPFNADGEDVTASVVLKGRVRDRSAALKKLGELLLRMSGE